MGQRSLPNFIKIKEEHMFSAIKYLVDENKKLIKEIEKKIGLLGETLFTNLKSLMTKYHKYGLLLGINS